MEAVLTTKVAEMLKFARKEGKKEKKHTVRKGKRREINKERGWKEGKERRREGKRVIMGQYYGKEGENC